MRAPPAVLLLWPVATVQDRMSSIAVACGITHSPWQASKGAACDLVFSPSLPASHLPLKASTDTKGSSAPNMVCRYIGHITRSARRCTAMRGRLPDF